MEVVTYTRFKYTDSEDDRKFGTQYSNGEDELRYRAGSFVETYEHIFSLSVSYLEFLKPFAFSRQRWKNGNNMAAVMQASQGETDQSHTGTQTAELGGLTTRLRKKV